MHLLVTLHFVVVLEPASQQIAEEAASPDSLYILNFAATINNAVSQSQSAEVALDCNNTFAFLRDLSYEWKLLDTKNQTKFVPQHLFSEQQWEFYWQSAEHSSSEET